MGRAVYWLLGYFSGVTFESQTADAQNHDLFFKEQNNAAVFNPQQRERVC